MTPILHPACRHARIAIAAAVAAAAVGLAAPAVAQPAADTPTFSRDVAPIFFEHCTNCHRPGQIAPMSLLTYKDARPWARAIATQVAKGAMPPWHADPRYGHFLNDRRLSGRDQRTIVAWASGDAIEGDPADLPPAPVYAGEWQIGTPDAVFSMQEDYPVPADGTIAYQYFQVPTGLTEDKWIQAIEVRPGNPAVVHHVIVYTLAPPPAPRSAVRPETRARRRPAPVFEFAPGMDVPAGQTGGPELPPDRRKPLGPDDRPAPRLGGAIGGFAPGQTVRVYQPGTAMKLPAGSVLVFQMHYTAAGKATTDRTRLGVKFAAAPPAHEVHFGALVNGSLHIPAGAPDYRVDADMTIGRDITLWSLLPHTHVRGIRWEYTATFPDGRTETILAVPKYDFNWQTDYVFETPLKLPRGTRVHASAWYDNSANNKSNPDPTKDVWWGDQTWEEMMFTGMTFSVDPAPRAPTAGLP